MQSICHQVVGWSPWEIVWYEGLSVGLCCWQLGTQQSMFLSPCIIFHHGHFFMSPLSNDRSSWRKRVAGIPRTGIIATWLLNPPLLRSSFDENSRETQISLHSLLIQWGLSTYPFPRSPCHQFSVVFLPSSWSSNQTIWRQPRNLYRFYLWPFLLSRQNEHPGALFKVLFTGSISTYHCPSGISQKESVVLYHILVVPAYYTKPSVNKAQVSSSSAIWLLVTFNETIGMGWEWEGNVEGVGTMGSWAFSSSIPSDIHIYHFWSQTQSHMYHFHLIMEC